jgi:PTH1 family peptidyl-tRNA hydrolase
MIKLIVGLGNIGSRYANTRHNAGFWVVDLIAKQNNTNFKLNNKFYGQIARLNNSYNTWLIKPETFMNRSGQAVAAISNFYNIQAEQILVIHDEIDLLAGKIKLKSGGGHGGHNGLRDIIQHLGTKDFMRLRIGVGHPGSSNEVVNYVLHQASLNEQQDINHSINQALEFMPLVIDGKIDQAMNKLHSI